MKGLMCTSNTKAIHKKYRALSLRRTAIINGSKVDRSCSYSKIDFALQQTNKENCQQAQGTVNLISDVADATSTLVNDFIEGGLDLFQSHGTVPAEVYNTLDKKKKKKKRKIHL